jgi:hypothetical protein
MNRTVSDVLAEISARAEAATGGAWAAHTEGGTDGTDEHWVQFTVDFGEQDEFHTGPGCMLGDYENAEADQAFITDARADVPTLLAAVRAAAEVMEAMANSDVPAVRGFAIELDRKLGAAILTGPA